MTVWVAAETDSHDVRNERSVSWKVTKGNRNNIYMFPGQKTSKKKSLVEEETKKIEERRDKQSLLRKCLY